jgi:hypothetical protein
MKTDVKGSGSANVNQSLHTQDRIAWWTLVNMVMDFRSHRKVEFLELMSKF